MARTRGSGSIYKQPKSPFWWLRFYRAGKQYRMSSGTENRRRAEALLRRKLAEIATDTFIEPASDRVLIEELAGNLMTEYKANGRKSLDDLEARWKLHIKPAFAHLRASSLTSTRLDEYVAQRQSEGATNATINRELAALRRMPQLGIRARRISATVMPYFPRLEERNVRTGFVEDAQYAKLAEAGAKRGLWFRTLLEMGYTYGWRVSELLGLRVRQVDLANRTIRLDPGTTKNDEGRTVVMTD